MKRVVVFAMVLMLGVVSVQAQWSVVPEAGMTVMKAGPMVDWKPSWKIGVGVEYQLKPEFLSLKSGLKYKSGVFFMLKRKWLAGALLLVDCAGTYL